MRLIDRYIFQQLLGPTVLATVALSGLALLSESLSAIGIVLNQRQSPIVFAQIVLLAMPQLIVLVLPVAVLVAGLATINRLHRDNEIAVCFANGASRWRVVSPTLRLASLVGVMSLAVSLWIQPLCYRQLRETLDSARTDVLGALIRPGQFTHPAPGVTVYAQSLADDGTIHNLFMDQSRADGGETTIMAREGGLRKSPGNPVLVLRHGQTQERGATGAVTFLSFDLYSLDLQSIFGGETTVIYKASDRYLHELLRPAKDGAWERANRAGLLAEANGRLSAPLYDPAFMLLATTAVIGGGFSRFGYGRRIALAGVAAAVARIIGFALQAASVRSPALNGLQYAVPLAVCAACLWLLFGPRLFSSPRGAPHTLVPLDAT
jgi:lipopolysaccharide export system permease protein